MIRARINANWLFKPDASKGVFVNLKLCRTLMVLGVLLAIMLLWGGLAPSVQAEHICDLKKFPPCPVHGDDSDNTQSEESQEDDSQADDSQADGDNDGVPDDEDECPNEPGIPNSPNGPGCPESEDTSSTGEDLDLDVEEEEVPETRFECVTTEEGAELCLFQAFLYIGDRLWVVRVVDRCQDSEDVSVCERQQDQLQCDAAGARCQTIEARNFTETCISEDRCTLPRMPEDCYLVLSNDACFEFALDPEFFSTGRVIHDHSYVAYGPEMCTMIAGSENIHCAQVVYICTVETGCTRTVRIRSGAGDEEILDCDQRRFGEVDSSRFDQRLLAALDIECVDNPYSLWVYSRQFDTERQVFLEFRLSCDRSTATCDEEIEENSCSDDLNSCTREIRRSEGICDYWNTPPGVDNGCEVTEITEYHERWTRRCDDEGHCTREGSRREIICESRSPARSRADFSCGGLFASREVSSTTYTVGEICPEVSFGFSSHAIAEPEDCTLLLSTETTRFADGSVVETFIQCDPDAMSCQITERTTHPDGRVESRSMTCMPNDSTDTAPYRDGGCIGGGSA